MGRAHLSTASEPEAGRRRRIPSGTIQVTRVVRVPSQSTQPWVVELLDTRRKLTFKPGVCKLYRAAHDGLALSANAEPN